jgi:hypothetical protein
MWSLFKYQAVELWDNTISGLVDDFASNFVFNVTHQNENKMNYTQDKSYLTIGKEITEIYNKRINSVNGFLESFNLQILPMSIIVVLLQSIWYHNKYLKKDKFSNYIIGARFHEIDLKRKKNRLPSLLPLDPVLNVHYTHLFSLNQTNDERGIIIVAVIILLCTMLPIFFTILLDLTMYEVNVIIKEYASIEIPLSDNLAPSTMKVEVKGKGFIASMYRNIFDSIYDISNGRQKISIDRQPCFQTEPNKPYYDVHTAIFVYSIILLSITVLQSYICRARSLIMSAFYPEREEERSLWLYKQLLQYKHVIKMNKSHLNEFDNKKKRSILQQIISFLMYLFKKIIYILCNFIFGAVMRLMCCYCFCTLEQLSLNEFYKVYGLKVLMCYYRLRPPKIKNKCIICLRAVDNDDDDFIFCRHKDCGGIYCIDCYQNLLNTCKLCFNILEYDEPDNDSLEIDSSDNINDQSDIEIQIEKEKEKKTIAKRKTKLKYKYNSARSKFIFNNSTSVLNAIYNFSYTFELNNDEKIIKVVPIRDERIRNIIKSKMKIFYLKLKLLKGTDATVLDDNDSLAKVLSSPPVMKCFKIKDDYFNLFNDLTIKIILNFINHISIDEYFDINDLNLNKKRTN